MKVVLLRDIRGLGRKFDVKEVKAGYFRNFLLPRQLAVLATAAAFKHREAHLAKEQALMAALQAAAEKLSGEILEFHLKTGDAGEVFGSVTTADLKKLLLERGYTDFEVELDRPLKSPGEYEVGITFSRGVKRNVTIKIV
jgi:large subunit ribosomal protein L9